MKKDLKNFSLILLFELLGVLAVSLLYYFFASAFNQYHLGLKLDFRLSYLLISLLWLLTGLILGLPFTLLRRKLQISRRCDLLLTAACLLLGFPFIFLPIRSILLSKIMTLYLEKTPTLLLLLSGFHLAFALFRKRD